MTIRYWQDLLGLRLVAGLGNERFRHYFFELSKTEMVAFFEWTGMVLVSFGKGAELMRFLRQRIL